MYWKKRLIIYLFLLFYYNIAFADQGQIVTPLIKQYQTNLKPRLIQKKEILNGNVDNQQPTYYINSGSTKKLIPEAQTSDPYFVRAETIRNSNGNLSTSNITNVVANSLEKPKENPSPKSSINKIEDVSSDIMGKVKDFGSKGFNGVKSTILSAPSFFKSMLSSATDEEVALRPTGMYKGFLISFMMAGTAHIAGDEERPNGVIPSTANAQWTDHNTFSTSKIYLPSVELGIFAGWQINSYLRSHLDLTWTYMYGNLGNVNTDQSGSPGSNFVLSNDAFNGHLFASTFNIYADPYRNLQVWPTIGVGAGAAMFVFNGYNNAALMYPLINIYLGFNFMLPDKKEIISVGYKLQYIMTGSANNQNQIVDANSATTTLTDTRPTNQDESVLSGIWIHKIEIAIRMY